MYYKPPKENAVNKVVCKADLAAPQIWENSYHLWEIPSHLTRNENVDWEMKWFMKDDMFCVDTIKERKWILNLCNAFLSSEIVSQKNWGKTTWLHHALPMAYDIGKKQKHITTNKHPSCHMKEVNSKVNLQTAIRFQQALYIFFIKIDQRNFNIQL